MRQRVTYKLAVLTHNVRTTATATYLSELVHCTVPMLRCSSFFAYTPNWPVTLFLLLLNPPETLYLLTFDRAKTFLLSTPLENPSIQTHLVLLCNRAMHVKRLCIFGPKGAMQIRYYYYCLSNAMHGQNINLPVCVCLYVCHAFCHLAYRSDPSTDFYS